MGRGGGGGGGGRLKPADCYDMRYRRTRGAAFCSEHLKWPNELLPECPDNRTGSRPDNRTCSSQDEQTSSIHSQKSSHVSNHTRQILSERHSAMKEEEEEETLLHFKLSIEYINTFSVIF